MTQCREIHGNDIDAVIALLTSGFGKKAYWVHALQRLADHPTPPGMPQYGYVLEHETTLVGVVLLICTDFPHRGASRLRCNVSSWYVMPAYRSYGSILAKRATRRKDVTYFNVTPAPHTRVTLEAQGFRRFADGRILSVPALNGPLRGVHVAAITDAIDPDRDLDPAEIDLLVKHKAYGCLSLVCEFDGQRHPFVFALEVRYRVVRIANLVYCRNVSDFIDFAGPIGRFLARRGCWLVKFLANGPVPGILGQYSGGRPQYCKGGDYIHPGDVAFSEQVMFGTCE